MPEREIRLTGTPEGDAEAFAFGISIHPATPEKIVIVSADGQQRLEAWAYRPSTHYNPFLSVQRTAENGKTYREFYRVSLRGKDAGILERVGRVLDSELVQGGRDLSTGGIVPAEGVLLKRKVKGGVHYLRANAGGGEQP